MIKVLIIDDEIKARNLLKHFIVHNIPQISEVRLAESVEAAWAVLENYDPQLIFLDVEMPYRNGFDFLSRITKPTFDVIFTTAYNQYAIQAIRFSALDYLLKPVDPEELIAAVSRYIDKQKFLHQNQLLYDNLAENIKAIDVKQFRLAVPSNEGVYFFTLEEILRLEADRNYTFIHLVGKRPFLASKTLKYFEELLEELGFIRTHKSHLVNASHVKRLGSNNDFVLLTDGAKVEVSRRKKEAVQNRLNIK